MQEVKSYAAFDPKSPLKPYSFHRRTPSATDVQIEIFYCGVCHSDLHWVSGDWGPQHYPVVPGHEIVGRVTAVGDQVRKFKTGDVVGVGCMVDSCQTCGSCDDGLEQYCEKGFVGTYGAPDRRHGGDYTQGGYSTGIVVDEKFVLKAPTNIPLEQVAPLLCAGITTYSPLRQWNVKKGDRVGVAGLGGLGHMAVKLAVAMGAHVTVLSTSEKKTADAKALGAHDFAVVKPQAGGSPLNNSLDLILNTISADHDYNVYLDFLKRDGTMVLLGIPGPQPVGAFSLIMKRRRLAGSLIGGIAETQEMLDFCGQHKIGADIELIRMDQINDAYKRMVKSDVRYRFVIDMKSLKG